MKVVRKTIAMFTLGGNLNRSSSTCARSGLSWVLISASAGIRTFLLLRMESLSAPTSARIAKPSARSRFGNLSRDKPDEPVRSHLPRTPEATLRRLPSSATSPIESSFDLRLRRLHRLVRPERAEAGTTKSEKKKEEVLHHQAIESELAAARFNAQPLLVLPAQEPVADWLLED